MKCKPHNIIEGSCIVCLEAKYNMGNKGNGNDERDEGFNIREKHIKEGTKLLIEELNDQVNERKWEGKEIIESTGLKDGGGQRFNDGKMPIHLVPVSTIRAIAEVFGYGAQKYSERNWERGMKWSVPYACCMRHLLAFWDGEDNDDESKLAHLKHALTNIAMLIEFEETYKRGDDRPNVRTPKLGSEPAETQDIEESPNLPKITTLTPEEHERFKKFLQKAPEWTSPDRGFKPKV